MEKLLDEYLDHIAFMDQEEGYNRESWDKWSKLNDSVTGKVHNLPGNITAEKVVKALKQLSISKILKKADKLNKELLLLLKSAYPQKEQYSDIDTALATEALQSYNGDEGWKNGWKDLLALHGKISRYENPPADNKKFAQLRELSSETSIRAYFDAIRKFEPLVMDGDDPLTWKKYYRPTVVSALALLSLEYKPEYHDFIENTFVPKEIDLETLTALGAALKLGDPKYLPLQDKIISKIKELVKDAFSVQLYFAAGAEPDWFDMPWHTHIEVSDAEAKGMATANKITLNATYKGTNTFFVTVTKNHESDYYPTQSWSQNKMNINFPEEIRFDGLKAYFDDLAQQAGYALNWDTLEISASKKNKPKLEAFIRGKETAAPQKKASTSSVQKVEEIMDRFLDPKQNAIASAQGEELLKWMRKLPSQLNEEKLYDSIIKLGSITLFRYAKSFPQEYMHLMQKAVAFFPSESTYYIMYLECMRHALDHDLDDPAQYAKYVETLNYLQYVGTLQFAMYDAADFAKSDKYITPAVAENVAKTIVATDYPREGGNIVPFNCFFYVLGKSNLPEVVEAVKFQLKVVREARNLYCIVCALRPNLDLANTAKAHQLAHELLVKIQSESVPFKLAQEIGLETAPDQSWRITIVVGSSPDEKYPRWSPQYISAEISSIWHNYLEMEIKTEKDKILYNENEGVWLGTDPGIQNVDVFKLKAEIDRVGKLCGIEELHWKHVDIYASNLDKKAKRKIKDWLGLET